MSLCPPDVYTTFEENRRVLDECEQRRNALRQVILNGDDDAIKACLNDWADDYASDFFRDVIGLVKADQPSKDVAESRYWLIRVACEKFLRRYLETIVNPDDVELEMRRSGLL